MKKPDIKWEHSIELDEKTIDSLEYVWELLELIPGVRVTKWPSKSEQCRVSIWFDDKEFQKVQSRGAGRKKRRTTEKYERFAEMLREKKQSRKS